MARSDVLINARVLRGAAAPSHPGEHAAWRISAGHPSRRPQGGPSLCLGSFGQATSSRDSCPPIPPPSPCSLARGFARCVLVGWKFYKSQVPAGCTSASFPPWSCDKPFGALTSLPTSTLPHIFARTSIISWILPEPFIRKVTPRWLQSGKRSWGEAACAWSLPGAVAPGPWRRRAAEGASGRGHASRAVEEAKGGGFLERSRIQRPAERRTEQSPGALEGLSG